jgi:hypothetical protein
MDQAPPRNDEAVAKPRRRVPTPNDPEFLVPLGTLCQVLNLPIKWARRMAGQGYFPCIRIGHRLMFHVDAVRQLLRHNAQRHNQFGRYPGARRE